MKLNIKFTWKIWLLIIFLVLSLFSIFWTSHVFQKGVLITNVEQNSSAFLQGFQNGMLVTAINGEIIENLEDYSKAVQMLYDSSTNVKGIFNTDKGEVIYYSNKSPQIVVADLKSTNLKTGLDLSGGARAIIQAENHSLTQLEANDLVSGMNNRFNVYGISDINIRSVKDLEGNYFVMIEKAGAIPDDLKNLISQQGKFEAKIGNETVFIGGQENGISDVGRNAQNSRVSCLPYSTDSYVCTFEFSVTLKPEAAEKHAEVTEKLGINSSNPQYLSKSLDLYVDDSLLSSLQISKDLKGRVTTQISISGSGTGATEQEALDNANAEMKNLQTILMTGSLPFKLEIVKLDTISPTLGQSFTKYILIAGVAALLSIALFLFLRYRTKSALVSLFICTAELIITLGVAAFLKQDLDLPSIAGILAAIGTGVDDQIVVLDETKNKESAGMKERIKRAFVIILGAYATVVVSLLPLLRVGAGMLRGFAIMTLIGITIGVLITRPAFADIVRKLEKE